MRKVVLVILVIFVILFTLFIIFKINNNKIDKKEENTSVSQNNINNESGSYNMKIVIKDKEYNINLENNETVTKLYSMLPLELNMSELNSNEKYCYIANTLPNNPKVPEKIEEGDVMLYGNNCIVLFYKSFATSYSYTKIGHIDNLPDLEDKAITVKFIN